LKNKEEENHQRECKRRRDGEGKFFTSPPFILGEGLDGSN